MRVILTEDVVGLGEIGELVSVKPGHARNFLIPKGFAVESEAKNARIIAHQMRQIEAKKRRLKGSAEALAQKLRSSAIDFELRVGSGGKVFGSIGGRDIAEGLGKLGFQIDRRRILLSELIKKEGTHLVRVKLHPEVEVQVKVMIRYSEATKEEEEQETQAAREGMERVKKDKENKNRPTGEGEEEQS